MADDLSTMIAVAEVQERNARDALAYAERQEGEAARRVRLARATAEQRRVELAELRRRAEVSTYPPKLISPNSRIRIKHGLRWYEYLIVYVPNRGYFTTGTREDNKHFRTWEKLVDWIRAQDGHGTIVPLTDDRNSSDIRVGTHEDYQS